MTLVNLLMTVTGLTHLAIIFWSGFDCSDHLCCRSFSVVVHLWKRERDGGGREGGQ